MIYEMPNRDTKEIYRPYNRPKEVRENMRRIRAPVIGFIQIDVMFMPRFKESNKGVDAILVLIDVYSRFCWVFPMQGHTSALMGKIFERWLAHIKFKVHTLTSDQEFNNKIFRGICQRHAIKQYFSDPYEKFRSSLAERMNRSVRDMIKYHMSDNNTREYVSALPMLIKRYNHTVHTAHKRTPYQVLTGSARPDFEDPKTPKRRIKVGDRVRFLIRKKTFDKGDKPRWSTAVYRVIGRDKLRFVLADSSGREVPKRYAVHQLQVVTTESSKPKFFETSPEPKGKVSVKPRKKGKVSVKKKKNVKVRQEKIEDGEVTPLEVRRSKRQRKSKYKSLSGMA